MTNILKGLPFGFLNSATPVIKNVHNRRNTE